jgi:hypothetical protein
VVAHVGTEKDELGGFAVIYVGKKKFFPQCIANRGRIIIYGNEQRESKQDL